VKDFLAQTRRHHTLQKVPGDRLGTLRNLYFAGDLTAEDWRRSTGRALVMLLEQSTRNASQPSSLGNMGPPSYGVLLTVLEISRWPVHLSESVQKVRKTFHTNLAY
jgi:hypothetical protein